MVERLQASAARLPRLPPDRARLESFRLGGEAIHLLAKDPLLPGELVDAAARAALTREMTRYDSIGKSIWTEAFGANLRSMPIPQLSTGT
jgi:phenylacetic acid degradation operon negative regulatory protein